MVKLFIEEKAAGMGVGSTPLLQTEDYTGPVPRVGELLEVEGRSTKYRVIEIRHAFNLNGNHGVFVTTEQDK